ncbi:MAG: TolC family outer membrane protein [Pseudomonadota bacterium]
MFAIKKKGQSAAFGFCILLGAITLDASRAQAETLADALVSAYNHSGLLEQNRAVLRAADEDVAAANSALLPVLRWSGSFTQTYGRTTTVSTSFFGTNASQNRVDRVTATLSLIGELLLYDWGATQLRVEASKETVLATRNTLIDIEQQVLLRAVQAYLSVIQSNELVALRNNNLRLLTQELRAARDRFEVGEVTRTDVALAEAQLANARSGLAAAQGDLLRAQEEFRNAVGRKPGRLTPPPRLPNVGNDLEGDKALAVRTHPLIRAAQHQVATADLLVQAAEASMNPRVTLNGTISLQETFRGPEDSRVGSIGIDVGQTIYQGGALSSAKRRAMAQRDAQRANLHVVQHNLQQGVGNAYAGLLSARAQLEASDRQIRAARIAFRGVREEATLGARTTLDVLDAEQALLDAQTTAVVARAQLYLAAYQVLAATGRLTARDLKLPVQIYDPEAYYNLVKDSPAANTVQGRKLDRVLRALGKD